MNMKTAIPLGWMLLTKTLHKQFVLQRNRLRTYKAAFAALAALMLCSTAFSQTVALIEISGQVINHEKNEPLPDVSVQIKGSVTGTITDNTGNFILRTKQ